ncbi:MAG: hypothetical protein HC887_07360, partial [Desulfobacteraceae bacterium]|nr:hypothetical protein [Desulfobacteraceae bacterium]
PILQRLPKPYAAGSDEIMGNFGQKFFKAVLSSLSDPKNVDAMLKGTDSVPEFMMNMGQQICEGCFELQKQMIDRASKIGQQTKAYSFEDMDQEVFRSFREIYEKEFKKFFQIPQLGLTRFYQERSNRLMDKLNTFNAHLSEFVYMFYVPIEKASAVMQEKSALWRKRVSFTMMSRYITITGSKFWKGII